LGSIGHSVSMENNSDPVVMAVFTALAASEMSTGSSMSFFLRLCARHNSRGICWKRQSNINELAESCTYWTNCSLADDDDDNDHKCDSNKDQARNTFTCKFDDIS
jgi:hypothetical protein